MSDASKPAAAAGYSGTPLARKLGIKPGASVYLEQAPESFEASLAPLPAGVVFRRTLSGAIDLAHVFATSRARLETALRRLRAKLAPNAVLWVSWPKKASKVPTDVTEDTIRALALPLGYVDVKVCAVDGTWSGLKLVVRKALR